MILYPGAELRGVLGEGVDMRGGDLLWICSCRGDWATEELGEVSGKAFTTFYGGRGEHMVRAALSVNLRSPQKTESINLYLSVLRT